MMTDKERKRYYADERKRLPAGQKSLAEKLDEHFAIRGWEDRYSGTIPEDERSLIKSALSEVERFERGKTSLAPGGRSLHQTRPKGRASGPYFEESEE